jgi:uncharacterized membrane protein YfcA
MNLIHAAGGMLDPLHIYGTLAVLVLGLSKTGFGGGGVGILSVPLMAMAMPANQMLGVLAVLLVIVDLLSNAHYIGHYEWPVLRWLLAGAVVGVIVGCVILVKMRGGGVTGATPADAESFNRKLALVIGILCVVFVIAQCLRLIGAELPTPPGSAASSVAVGTVAGTVSTVAHSAGPIVMLYLLQERMEKRRLVATSLLYTLLINSFKLLSYVVIGTVTLATVRASLWMIPILPIGTLAGVWMNRKLPEKPFTIIMYAAAALAAGEMIYKAMA